MMKQLLLTLVLATAFSHARAWSPDLIEFSLEGGEKIETMIWISGFSYSSTAFFKSCGALKESEHIKSSYLIGILNEKYSGEAVSSEQATELLAKSLRSVYVCKSI